MNFIFIIKLYIKIKLYFRNVIFFIFQYEGIYNFPQRVFDKAVGAVEIEGESEAESEHEEEKELEKELEMELEADDRETEQDGPEYVEADSDDDDYEDDNNDIEELSMVSNKKKVTKI